jgi:hypothetical protein
MPIRQSDDDAKAVRQNGKLGSRCRPETPSPMPIAPLFRRAAINSMSGRTKFGDLPIGANPKGHFNRLTVVFFSGKIRNFDTGRLCPAHNLRIPALRFRAQIGDPVLQDATAHARSF